MIRNWIAPVGFGAAELEKRGQLLQGNCKYREDNLFDCMLTKVQSCILRKKRDIGLRIRKSIIPTADRSKIASWLIWRKKVSSLVLQNRKRWRPTSGTI